MRHLRRASRDPIGFYRSAWESYGDFVRIHWFGPFSAYLAVHPDSVEQVLQATGAPVRVPDDVAALSAPAQ